MRTYTWTTPVAAVLAAVATLLFSSPAVAEQGPAASTQDAARDPGWPRTYTTADGCRVQVFQPQIASWDDQKRLVAYAAVAHLAAASTTPALGTIKVEADTTVAVAERLVSFTTLAMTEANFGSIDRERTRHILADIERAMADAERVIALDRVLAGLDRSEIQAAQCRRRQGRSAEGVLQHDRRSPRELRW